jgi:hypothetical protein
MTIDPTGIVARMTRAALDVLDAAVVQVDVPADDDAALEMDTARFRVVVSALSLISRFDGVSIARRVRQAQPDAVVILLADEADYGFEMPASDVRRYIVLHRPADGERFVHLLAASLEGRDPFEADRSVAIDPPASRPFTGIVPPIDTNAAIRIVDALLDDVGGTAAVMSTRTGAVLFERGATGLVDRELLTAALLPTLHASLDLARIIGGPTSGLMVFDGVSFQIYVLTVGLHHIISLIFTATNGSRALGAVNRYGRRASEDLIALIGAGALLMEAPPAETPSRGKKRTTSTLPALPLDLPDPEPLQPVAVRAEAWEEPPAPVAEETPLLEPIAELDENIFQDDLGELTESAFEDLFDPEKLAEIATETRRERGPLSYEEARELGLIP